MTSLAELIAEANRLSKKIDAGVEAMTGAGRDYAQAEHDYRVAKAKAWAQAPAGTVPEREAWVNARVADERRTRDLAESMRTAAWEALRARRAPAVCDPDRRQRDADRDGHGEVRGGRMRPRCVHPGHDRRDCWEAFAFGLIGLREWCEPCDQEARK